MNRTTRHAADARSRALDRLRAITMGTAVAGFAGVGGFGVVAAISNSGTQQTTVAAADGTTEDGSTTAPTTNGTSGKTRTTTTTPTTTSNLTPAATPKPTKSRAHVTTGGS